MEPSMYLLGRAMMRDRHFLTVEYSNCTEIDVCELVVFLDFA